jgi:TP901 family phage tail tape measure protein
MGTSASQVAVGLDIIGSAAFRGADAIDILTRATKMSAIGMGTVEETTRAVVGAMLTFTKEHLTAAQASDILVKTVQLGNMRIGDLVSALARVNPLAAAMGVKFADVNAIIATFTHLGAPAEVAATGVRAIMSAILHDGAATEKGLKGLKISMSDVTKEIEEKGLAQALVHLVQAAQKMPDGLEELGKVFPNIKALTTVLATAGSQADFLLYIAKQTKEAAGSLEGAWEETKNTWATQWNQIVVAFEVFAIKASETLLPAVKEIVRLFKDDVFPVLDYAMDVFKNLPVPLQIAGGAFLGLAAVAGPVLVVVGEMIRSWGHISALMATTDIASLVPSFAKLTTAIGESTFATMAFQSAMGLGVAAVFAATLYEIYQAADQLWKWWKEHEDRVASDLRQQSVDAGIISLSQKDFIGPIRDIAMATEILTDKTHKIVAANVMYGPAIQEVTEKLSANSIAEYLIQSQRDHAKYQIEALNPLIADEAKNLFQLGLSSAEAFKHLKAHNLVTDEQ